MYLSGALGYELFKLPSSISKDIFLLILPDMHDGVSYCDNTNIKISKFLKNRQFTNNILLEESTQKEANLKDLWPNAPHTQELKKLAFDSYHINSFDIRPLLLPFSWELIDVDKSLGEKDLQSYISFLDDFFNKKSLLYNKYILTELNKSTFLKKKNNLHFIEIFDQYMLFKKQNTQYKDSKLSKIKKTNIDILHKINEITSYIMEWYIVLLILNNNKNSIIHAGLSHTENISKMLKDFYKFELIERKGFFNLKDVIEIEKPKACVYVPEYVTSKFGKKFNFFSNIF